MSASIFWDPIKPANGHVVGVGAPSWFMGCMERAGLKLPVDLTVADLPVLTGLAAAQRDDEKNPFQEIIDAIEKHGAINLWYQY